MIGERAKSQAFTMDLEGLRMPKPRLSAAEKRRRTNAQQKSYRQRNPELYEIWRQRSYRNYLVARGWTVTPPPDFPTLEAVHSKRDLLRQLDGDPIDLSCDLDADEIAEILEAIGPDDPDEQIDNQDDVPW